MSWEFDIPAGPPSAPKKPKVPTQEKEYQLPLEDELGILQNWLDSHTRAVKSKLGSTERIRYEHVQKRLTILKQKFTETFAETLIKKGGA